MLKLDDRQQLKLIPVNRYGYRLVAFVIPQQAGIAAATAYLSNGRYAITIPVNSPYGMTSFNSWVWHGPGGALTRHGMIPHCQLGNLWELAFDAA